LYEHSLIAFAASQLNARTLGGLHPFRGVDIRVRVLRLQPALTTALGACLAACWAAIASLASTHKWIPSTAVEGIITLVVPPLCASILLAHGGFRGWDRLGREPRVRVAGYLYLLAILAALGLCLFAIFEFVMSSMIGACC
jgi:hypothetical protein